MCMYSTDREDLCASVRVCLGQSIYPFCSPIVALLEVPCVIIIGYISLLNPVVGEEQEEKISFSFYYGYQNSFLN